MADCMGLSIYMGDGLDAMAFETMYYGHSPRMRERKPFLEVAVAGGIACIDLSWVFSCTVNLKRIAGMRYWL